MGVDTDMKKPCSNCSNAIEYNSRKRRFYDPDWRKPCCCHCDLLKKYKDFRESKKKYFRGNPIESIFEFCSLDAQSLVYWHDKIKHISVIKSMPYRVVESAISHKALFKAIKKSEADL